MSLSDFLLARIAEDEEWAERERLWLGGDKPWSLFEAGLNMPGGIGIDPRRLTAECEAKRRIVRMVQDEAAIEWAVGDGIYRALALPYADHPDYDEAWRP